jgi:predicted DNA-binding WGR domain protein/ABC-type transporter Mla subunit MlaD
VRRTLLEGSARPAAIDRQVRLRSFNNQPPAPDRFMTTFHEFLLDRIEHGGFTTEDALASFLPLVRQVIASHEAGLCAPLEGIGALQVENGEIGFDESSRCPPRNNLSRLRRLLKPEAKAVEVTGTVAVVHDVDTGFNEVESKQNADREVQLERPAWLRGYLCWEHRLEHHDPLTDVFSLGLILASLACSLDLTLPEDHRRFVAHRSNLFALTPGLHPVLAKAIRTMTELDRQKRPQDLRALSSVLENYRDQEVDFETDLARSAGFAAAAPPGKRRILLDKLRERLFEVSRRNRLLDFKPTMQSVNLTQASIPLMFDYRNVRENQIVTWGGSGSFQREVLAGHPVSLNKHLNFREAIYLPGTLDRVRSEASRDEREFGFAQLRLVICFVRWANLKEKPPERYESPLLLLPVRLSVKKGIHDRHFLTALETKAEVNPVIRHLFKQLYDIDLPVHVEPTPQGIDEFHADLNARIQASDPSVTLTKIDRPRIDLIHEKAKRRLDQFRRHARLSGRGIRSFLDLDYSYDPTNYHPLGVRIFKEFVRPGKTHLERIVSGGPPPPQYIVEPSDPHAAQPDVPPTAEAEQKFYQVRKQADDNPYNWEFDLCTVTLANLRYRRMSLVRDYGELADDTAVNPAFEATFAIAPRESRPALTETVPLKERFHVVSCDPTQTRAIALARSGASYIIQGPPGTGKSQTITNLIADFVVRGKRALFVCEKRAAIDVVYHRLKQRGLHELCCLIHDSQADKKEFVMDLKATYESHLADADKRRDQAAARRGRIVAQFEQELGPLELFDAAMRSVPASGALPLRSILDRRIRLAEHVPDLSPREWERIPFYSAWHGHRPQLTELGETIRDVQPDGILAHHRLHLLSGKVAEADRPLELVSRCLTQSRSQLSQLRTKLGRLDLPPASYENLEQLRAAVGYARQAAFLARVNAMSILNAQSEPAQRWQSEIKNIRQCDQEISRKREVTQAWREKLSPSDVETALAQARQFEGRALSFLKPAWWRLRRVLNRAYDFSQHKVRPSWIRILDQLREVQQAVAQRDKAAGAICNSFGLESDFDEFEAELASLQQAIDKLPDSVRSLHNHVTASAGSDRTIRELAALADDLNRLLADCDQFLDAYRHSSLPELDEGLGEMEDSLDELPDYLHCLAQLNAIPADLAESIRSFPISLQALEAATAQRSLQLAWRDRSVGRFDGTAQRRQVARLRRLGEDWQKVNAQRVREFIRQTFVDNVNTASKPAAQLTAQQKGFKQAYNRGRRELEHEFAKSMRYKSIRDLMSGDAGSVIRDLKPVWLMSPLSVSDTLPLNAENFDVVIFDEASQITLEEAVPSIFRANQAIVVGDQMQLPPTTFFMSQRPDEDGELTFEENGELVKTDLDSSSFLNQAARNLPSCMLAWHYRSQSESLISFSNHAFYDGRLLTVPDAHLAAPDSRELSVESSADASQYADELLDRAVSFHFLQHGIYENRRNTEEADYIAGLVRRILEREEGRSIGIIAFSEAQQAEIESALARLADEDLDFARRLELELEREENDQFVGLLVKNLENIQGDERDVIIMSVCYGPARDGKVRMNFGPINLSGGHKRLNVAFSRARCQMALISSIRSADITNDYNEGANTLKNYLRYAEAASIGDAEITAQILRALSQPRTAIDAAEPGDDAVVGSLAQTLNERGYRVDRAVGQSHFRCDLAVARPEDRTYRLGVLVDTSDWYAQRDLVERELLKPDLLVAFGWRIHVVLARDWYEDRAGVLERIERLLAGEDLNNEPDDESEPLSADPPLAQATEASAMAPPAGTDASRSGERSAETSDLDDHVSHAQIAQGVEQAGFDGERWSEYLEYVGGGSSEFWEISVRGREQTVRFGRVGSRGQALTKSFSDRESALTDSRRQADGKRRKGYRSKEAPRDK